MTITLVLTGVCATAVAETVLLNDGTVIHGDIRSLRDDVYTIVSDSLGTLQVRKRDVRKIDSSVASSRQSPTGSSIEESPREPADLLAVQSRLMQNADLFSMIRELQNDPEVQAVLADPEIMRAISSGDIATLMSHPKIIGLTSNSSMREIIEAAR